ncbi:YcxB family protein [Anaerosporobacter faecicola]|uniref:YcxB family protein n=1 Tax=Anaerosporobacter faecicola TaxID=2718714 RepID=UPI00143BB64C|nr:YcxB family protein [Anaerosporobacter faecicola]
MKVNKLLKIVSVIVTISLLLSNNAVAKTQEYEVQDMKLELSEDVIILDHDLETSSPLWEQAGIEDVKSQKEEYNKMGVVASFYKKQTDTYINLLCKTSTKSHDIYNMSELSEDELDTFIATLMESTDENTKIQAERYDHAQVPFYKLVINVTGSNQPITEVIYGTIVNGVSITFDIYNPNGDTVDETFLKEVVDPLTFTKIVPREEAYRLENESKMKLIIVAVVIAILILSMYIIGKKRSKEKNNRKKERIKKIEDFRVKLRSNKEEGIVEKILFENNIDYDKNVLKEFIIYNRFVKHTVMYVILALLFLVILYLGISSDSSIISILVVIALGGGFIYAQINAMNKQIEIYTKRYEKPENNCILFYENYFSVKKKGSVMDYPYLQIHKVSQYKEYIFVYIGSDTAIYLHKEKFTTGTVEEFLEYIKKHIDKI